MAIFSFNIKIKTRSKGQSAVSSSGYISGEKLKDEETNIYKNYTHKDEIVYKNILLPADAPSEYKSRQVLWNAVHKIEKNNNAQLCRSIITALPKELKREEQITLLENYIQNNFVDKGMCADFAIHDKEDGNPHAHILLTLRSINEEGKWKSKKQKKNILDDNGERIPITDKKTGKQRTDKSNRKQWQTEIISTNDWNDKDKAELWRENWAEVCNKFLSRENQVSHLSYEKQNLEIKPQIHEGYMARKIEEQGGVSERCEHNREIRGINKIILGAKNKIIELGKQIKNIFQNEKEVIVDKKNGGNYERNYGTDKQVDRKTGTGFIGKLVKEISSTSERGSSRNVSEVERTLNKLERETGAVSPAGIRESERVARENQERMEREKRELEKRNREIERERKIAEECERETIQYNNSRDVGLGR